MFSEDELQGLEKRIEGTDSPRSAVWFPLVVMLSSWYTGIWFAWWLGTPAPSRLGSHMEAHVHFGAMTGTMLLLLFQIISVGPFPKLGSRVVAVVAVSTLILFVCTLVGPGSLFRNFQLSPFNLPWHHRHYQAFFFQFVLSAAVGLLTIVSFWLMLSVLLVSIKFCGAAGQPVFKRTRIIRLAIAMLCALLLFPTLDVLRTKYPMISNEPSNSLAYGRWLFQVLIAVAWLWCASLLMTRFRRHSVRLGVGLLFLWFSLWLLWANHGELRYIFSGSLTAALLSVLGFLLLWSVAMVALFLDRKMPILEPHVDCISFGSDSKAELSTPIQQRPAFPNTWSWRVGGTLAFLLFALIATRFPTVYEPITLITPHRDPWDRASQVSRLWQFALREADMKIPETSDATHGVYSNTREPTWNLVVPLETAILPGFRQTMAVIDDLNVRIHIDFPEEIVDSSALLQLKEMGFSIRAAYSVEFFRRHPDVVRQIVGQHGTIRIKNSTIDLDDANALLQQWSRLSFNNCTFHPSALDALIAGSVSLELIDCPELHAALLRFENGSAID